MAAPGWNAKGKLEPLWQLLEPPTREALANMTGIAAETLSGYNSGGRPLGEKNGKKIAAALGVSLYDLGAPRTSREDFAISMLGQIVAELERDPPQVPDHLRELAIELRGVASRLEERAAGLDDGTPP